MNRASEAAAQAAPWPNLFGVSKTESGQGDGDLGARVAEILPACLVDRLLGDASGVSADMARASLLLNRLNLSRQLDCLDQLIAAEFPFVVLKGLASAHQLFPEPALRVSGDLDILVRREDLERAARVFTDQGYRFGASTELPSWGFISEASYAELTAPDGVVSIDLHIEADCHPLFAGLPADQVFAEAVEIDASGRRVLTPRLEHAFLICLSNAAKERFELHTAKALVDAGRIACLRDLDWPLVLELADRASLSRPLTVWILLLRALDCPADRLPEPPQSLGPLQRRAFDRLTRVWLSMDVGAEGPAGKLSAEFLLGSEPAVFARRMGQRAKGLVRKRQGVPDLD